MYYMRIDTSRRHEGDVTTMTRRPHEAAGATHATTGASTVKPRQSTRQTGANAEGGSGKLWDATTEETHVPLTRRQVPVP